MAGTVDISVVVPCYNTERFLDQALSSAAQNSSCNIEVLAIDDGSKDGSLAIMQSHAARDPRIRVLHKDNEGYGATVNRGIAQARGTYVAILEPDDYVLPGAYDKIFSLACKSGMPDVVKSPYWRVASKDGADERRAYGYLHGRVSTLGRSLTLEEEPQLIQYHPSVWSAIYRRAFLDEEGIRMVEAPGAGWVDNPFSVETLAAARSIVCTDEAFYCYREDLASASSASVSARLMIDRWNERQDALERRGKTSRDVLRANYVVALRFFSQMLAQGALEDELLRADAKRMAQRLDPTILQSIDCVSPHVVKFVLELAGSPLDAPSKAAYAAHLVREAWWAARNNGIRFLISNIRLAQER